MSETLVNNSISNVACSIWHVLLTKSRQEKALALELSRLGIDCFLPLVSAVRYHGGRKVVVDSPMFSSYIFLHGSIDDAYQADRTDRVARIIPVFDQQKLDGELKNIQLALSRKAQMGIYNYLKNGIRVEVRSGPLKGLQGVVEDRKANRIFLQVDLLNSAVGMEIDGSLLVPIE